MEILLRKKGLARIHLRQIKRIAPDDFSLYSLNIKPFYHGLAIKFFGRCLVSMKKNVLLGKYAAYVLILNVFCRMS